MAPPSGPPQEARQQPAQRRRHQQHRGQADVFHALGGRRSFAQQGVGEARLDGPAFRPAAGHGLHQDPLEARVEGHHLHLAVARKEPLDNGPAKSLAHPRGEL